MIIFLWTVYCNKICKKSLNTIFVLDKCNPAFTLLCFKYCSLNVHLKKYYYIFYIEELHFRVDNEKDHKYFITKIDLLWTPINMVNCTY